MTLKTGYYGEDLKSKHLFITTQLTRREQQNVLWVSDYILRYE